MNSWIFIIIILEKCIFLLCSDAFVRDFQIFSKNVCKSGCSRIRCFANTLISIESVTSISTATKTKCSDSSYSSSSSSSSQYNCHFKFIQNHVFKTCSNTKDCDICPDKIESAYVPGSFCTSENDFVVKYRCIPGFIKIENVCANSYLDIDCYNTVNEKLVILNASLHSKIQANNEDSRGCALNNPSDVNMQQCENLDRTNQAISKCSFRGKCSIGPHGFSPARCGNMHMRITYACVSSAALQTFNEKLKQPDSKIITLRSTDADGMADSWFRNYKWIVLGISVSLMITIASIITLIICLSRKRRAQRSCNINTPKENLFSKLGQVNFSPPPSSIDKVNIEFETESMPQPELYNCVPDAEDQNIRSIYSSKYNSAFSYNSPFCMPPAPINTCQYFAPLLSQGHSSMLEMPSIQQASSGNLTSSTNSSHGTPIGTKSSGIFSMNDNSFDNSHLV